MDKNYLGALAFLNADIGYVKDAFWKEGTVPKEAQQFRNWVYGACGGMSLALGILIIFIAANAFMQKQKWTWNALLVAFITWYLVDSFFSIYCKIHLNALLNTVYIIIMLLPLIFSKKHFSQ